MCDMSGAAPSLRARTRPGLVPTATATFTMMMADFCVIERFAPAAAQVAKWAFFDKLSSDWLSISEIHSTAYKNR